MREVKERLETRAAPADYDRIAAAAQSSNQSLSQFLLEAALHQADTVLGPMAVTAMPVDQYESMLDALDADPVVVPELAKALREPVRFQMR